jgi:hypothetical protein
MMTPAAFENATTRPSTEGRNPHRNGRDPGGFTGKQAAYVADLEAVEFAMARRNRRDAAKAALASDSEFTPLLASCAVCAASRP